MLSSKIFTLPFRPCTGRFDDESFGDFVKDKEVLEVSDYFFEYDRIPHLALVVKYKMPSLEGGRAGRVVAGKGGEDWRKLLDDESMPLFNTLRQWRSEESKKDGIPPYVILSNRQLAEICRRRPRSGYDLMKVEGVGKAKVEKYRERILECVSSPLTAEASR